MTQTPDDTTEIDQREAERLARWTVVGPDQTARQAISVRMEEMELSGEGVVEAYLAEWGKFNSHDEMVQRGAFAESISQRFDQIKPNMFHRWDQPLAPRAEVLREDDRGLWARVRIVGFDDPDLNRRNWRLLQEGLVDGASIEFAWRQSSYRALSAKEREELEAKGVQVPESTWWSDPVVFDRVHLLGFGFVLHPSADGARVEAVRAVERDLGRVLVPGWRPAAQERARVEAPVAAPVSDQSNERDRLTARLRRVVEGINSDRAARERARVEARLRALLA